MNFIQRIIRYKLSRLWLIIMAVIMVLLIVINSLAVTVFNNLLTTMWGSVRRVNNASEMYYSSDYNSKQEALNHGNELNVEINEEGIVLLKNEDNALPIENGSKISVFGKNSVNLVYGGSGSGGGNTAGAKTLYESLKSANLVHNPILKSFYENNSQSGDIRSSNPTIENGGVTGFSTRETPQSSYTSSIKNSYAQYDDAALVVFSRIGGEGFDLPRTMINSYSDTTPVSGAYSADDHYLELDKNEQDLLQAVCENFNKVIVIINSSATMELGFLDDLNDGDLTVNEYDYASHIQAALWIGGPGNTGIMALGKVLIGDISPSGHLVDTYVRDFSKDPTWENLGTNLSSNGDKYTVNGVGQSNYFVDYEEGIYMGYRYYETRGFTDGEVWYDNNVVFPFGYGLSYTNFSWTIQETTPSTGSILSKDGSISVIVRVTNNGDVAGKDVVQLYYTAPYTTGGIEKSYVVLGAFEKTGIIQPDAYEDITIELKVFDMSSYDYNDKNANGFIGYEIEEGTYEIKICRNAHDVVDTVNYTVPTNGFNYPKDTVNGTYDVVNRFDQADDQLESILSRSDWEGTWPTMPDADRREVDSNFISSLKNFDSGNTFTTTDMPKQAETEQLADIPLIQLKGKSYNDDLWEEFLDQLTIDTMIKLCNNGAFQTVQIEYVGKPRSTDADGPVGFVIFMGDPTVYDTCVYASECVIAATWNKDLAYEMGKSVGNEGIWGNAKGDGAPYSGWYAPAINLHRSPFSGRNFEYYSEDGFLSGKMAANVIQGAKSKGVYTQVKHFAVNDQETHRAGGGLCTWLTEQSMREIYLKPFEIAVKEGETNGMMSSFNRIGSIWAGGSYELLTEVLRNEWGFKGIVICDFNTASYMNSKQMAYAGGDLNLATLPKNWVNKTNATDVTILRNNTKNILYTVVNSNAMNGIGEDGIIRYKMPLWTEYMLWIDAIAVIGIAVWGYFAIRKAYKK